MQYRNTKDENTLSLLGYGCMRFSKRGTLIDIEKTTEEIKTAFEGGVNYYDTAYIYPGSEEALGEIVKRLGIRDKIYIATKLPQYIVKSTAQAEKIFNEELRRLRTDYIDYYLMHMLADTDNWQKLIDIGILDWLLEKKAAGQIRHIGFSYHGSSSGFKALINAYDWDFAQIQYNYLDEHSQAGVDGLRYAASKNIPIIIMEGLRGGRLVEHLPDGAKKLIKEYGKETAASLAFKWLFNQPEITTVLSGMNSLEMVRQNLATANNGTPGCLTADDAQLIEKIKNEISSTMKVGCTGCAYCMPCPQGVDIPGTFSCYNKLYSHEKKSSTKKEYLQITALRKNTSSASQCISCGKCEQHCPQHIKIRKELKNAAKELETPIYKLAKWGVKTLHFYGN